MGDNDPVYWAVHKASQEWGNDWARRFCMGMLTYYHVGVAVEAADLEGAKFWEHLMDIYGKAPRGTMRRHFRGTAGQGALILLRDKFPRPEDFFSKVPLQYDNLVNYCKHSLLQFGPYFQLKLADYMDRCLDLPINPTSMARLASNLPSVPAEAAKVLYPNMSTTQAFISACMRIDKLKLLAPPSFNRPVGPAEVETALCDWAHARTGDNWIGADILGKRADYAKYGGKAAQMASWMPPSIPKDTFKLELQ